MTGPATPRVVDLVVRDHVAGDLREEAWRLYLETFEPLRAAAMQRHVMDRGEFDHVMADQRVLKYVGRDLEVADPTGADDRHLRRLGALATFSNDLASMPLVSPEFFQARWPDYYDRGRCFCIGFVAIRRGYQTSSLFEQIGGHMTDTVVTDGGVVVVDVCRLNSERRLPEAMLRVARSRDASIVATAVDEQTYWVYEPVRPPSVIDLREPSAATSGSSGVPGRP